MSAQLVQPEKLVRVNVRPRSDRPHSRNVMPGSHADFIGPFIYFDHLGPFHFPAGRHVYIPPHPHAGIATISYLFEGEGHHVDSLGNNQILHARRLNYMSAGNGIIHSEGLSEEFTAQGGRLCGIQVWHLLSDAERNAPARFQSLPESELLRCSLGSYFSGVVLMGQYQNQASAIETEQRLLLMTLENDIAGSADIELRGDWEYLFYVVDGSVRANDQLLEVGEGLALAQFTQLHLSAESLGRAVLLGGSKLQEQPLFNGSLVSVGAEQMADYMSRIREHKIGTMPENKPML